MSLIFLPNNNNYNTCDCYRCTPQEPTHLGFFDAPIIHRKSPKTARKPVRQMVRKPFQNFFDDDFMTFGNRSNNNDFYNRSFNPFTSIYDGFDSQFDNMENDFFENDFFNHKRLRPSKTQRNLNKPKLGKENVDPCFNNKANIAKPKQENIYTTPTKNTDITDYSTNDTLKNKPFFESRQFNSNTYINNGNRTTINKKTVTKNDETKTVVEKITQNKQGDVNITEIIPEKYDTEVKALFDNEGNEDLIIKEVENNQNNNMIAQEPLNEDQMFEEKIKESSNSFEKVNNNEDSKSNSNSGNMMFSDIQF